MFISETLIFNPNFLPYAKAEMYDFAGFIEIIVDKFQSQAVNLTLIGQCPAV